MKELVSIFTATYNHEKYIAECIQSVLDQTYLNWEMIILNDGSNDNTENIIKPFLKDERIKLINQSNVGIFRLNETYNYALSISKGKYIAILDGDDLWEKNKLELQMDFINKNPEIILCWSKSQSISSDKKNNYGIYPQENLDEILFYNNDPIGSILNILFYKNCIPALTILVKKDSLLQIGGFYQGYGLPLVDLPTLYELATVGKFGYIPMVLGKWRIYAKQITKTYPAQMMEGFYNLAKNNFIRFKENKNLHFDVNENKMNYYYKKQLIIAYSRAGRYKLIREDFKNARKDYKKSLLIYGLKEPMWKLRSLIGYIYSFLHLNIEGLSKLLGKQYYSKE